MRFSDGKKNCMCVLIRHTGSKWLALLESGKLFWLACHVFCFAIRMLKQRTPSVSACHLSVFTVCKAGSCWKRVGSHRNTHTHTHTHTKLIDKKANFNSISKKMRLWRSTCFCLLAFLLWQCAVTITVRGTVLQRCYRKALWFISAKNIQAGLCFVCSRYMGATTGWFHPKTEREYLLLEHWSI